MPLPVFGRPKGGAPKYCAPARVGGVDYSTETHETHGTIRKGIHMDETVKWKIKQALNALRLTIAGIDEDRPPEDGPNTEEAKLAAMCLAMRMPYYLGVLDCVCSHLEQITGSTD